MRDEEYNRYMREFDSYIQDTRKNLSDSVTAMGQAILAVSMEKIETDKKISERNDKIDKLLEE